MPLIVRFQSRQSLRSRSEEFCCRLRLMYRVRRRPMESEMNKMLVSSAVRYKMVPIEEKG